MSTLEDLTVDDLEHLIEQKMLEFFGDPDSGLVLRAEFREELQHRLKNPLLVDKSQAYFWTGEWQAGEREAETDIRSGRIRVYKSAKELIKELD